MGASATPSTPTLNPPKEGSTTPKRAYYIIRQRAHPTGFELTVEDATRQVLYLVHVCPTEPSRYVLSHAEGDGGKPLVVRRSQIELTARYTLFDQELEQLSLLQAFPPARFLLRDSKRHTIAKFAPLGPGIVVLRTSTTTLARLRFTEHAAPVGLRVDCDALEAPERLLAIILFTIAVADQTSRPGPASEVMRTLLAPRAIGQP